GVPFGSSLNVTSVGGAGDCERSSYTRTTLTAPKFTSVSGGWAIGEFSRLLSVSVSVPSAPSTSAFGPGNERAFGRSGKNSGGAEKRADISNMRRIGYRYLIRALSYLRSCEERLLCTGSL